jgi:hypothetical protein
MRLDDDQDITLEEMLVDARRFPFPLLTSAEPSLPRPREIRLTDTSVVVPDTCLRLVDGPLVGL